jgi:hypothetical protein
MLRIIVPFFADAFEANPRMAKLQACLVRATAFKLCGECEFHAAISDKNSLTVKLAAIVQAIQSVQTNRWQKYASGMIFVIA